MPSTPLSVLEFANTSVRGGVEEHVLLLLKGLDRDLFRLHLACPPELVRQLSPDLPGDEEVIPTVIQSTHDFAALRQFCGVLRRHRIEVLHSHMFFSSLFASPIGRLSGVPVVLETPHVSERWRMGWLKSHFWIDRMVSRCVDRYIAVSEANARYLMSEKRIPSAKIAVIPNGVDLSRFVARSDGAPELRSAVALGPHDRLLVVLGRLEPQKGHAFLLSAWPAVLAEFPNVHVVCLGDGRLKPGLLRQAQELGIESSVHFVGYQKNVADWLALCEFTVLPSLYEGLPLVAIESLAAGKTMVATAVDGTPEVVLHEKTGLTVPPGEPDDLARAICRLLREPDLRARFAAAGESWVRQNFSHKKQVAQTQELYLRELRMKGIVPRPQHAPREVQAVGV